MTSLETILSTCRAVEGLAEKATPGPWTSDNEVFGWWHGEQPGVAVRGLPGETQWNEDKTAGMTPGGDSIAMVYDMTQADISGSERPLEDAAFIAQSRTLLPALATALQEAAEALRIVSESGVSADSTVNVMLLSAHKKHSAEILARIAASLTAARQP